MKALVLDESGELAELIGIYLSTHGSAQVVATHSPEEALRHLAGEMHVFFIHASFTRPGNDLVWQTWLGKKSGETVIVGEGDAPADFRRLNPQFFTQELRDLVKSSFWRQLTGGTSSALPLSPFVVYRLGVCPADLFLKLGENNWVKLFHEGSPFGEGERLKFESKGVKEFWVMPEDLLQASSHIEDLLSSLAPSTPNDGHLVFDAVELIWNFISETGFREELQTLVRQAVKQVLRFSRHNPDLRHFLDVMARHESSWMIRHSLVTSHVGCAIAFNLGWTAEQTYLKITTAAFTHDMAMPRLDTTERQWQQMVNDSVGREKNYGELKAFLHHPIDGAQLVRRFKDLPPDTDKIVLEHHENPEGTGFPRGLSASQISPLGCLFILSHHIAEILIEDFPSSNEWSQQKLVEKLQPERWDQGNFKKIWQAFEKTQLFA